jgi:hypothetical protein
MQSAPPAPAVVPPISRDITMRRNVEEPRFFSAKDRISPFGGGGAIEGE